MSDLVEVGGIVRAVSFFPPLSPLIPLVQYRILAGG